MSEHYIIFFMPKNPFIQIVCVSISKVTENPLNLQCQVTLLLINPLENLITFWLKSLKVSYYIRIRKWTVSMNIVYSDLGCFFQKDLHKDSLAQLYVDMFTMSSWIAAPGSKLVIKDQTYVQWVFFIFFNFCNL